MVRQPEGAKGSYIPIPILSIVLSRGVPESSFKSSWSLSSVASSSMAWSECGDVGLSIATWRKIRVISPRFGLVDGFGKKESRRFALFLCPFVTSLVSLVSFSGRHNTTTTIVV